MRGKFSVQVDLLVDGELMLSELRGDGTLTVGPDVRCGVYTDALEQPLTLLTPIEGGYGLRLATGIRGKLRASGRTLRVAGGLLHDPRPEPLVFGDGDRGALWLSERLQLRFSVHRQCRAFVAAVLPRDPQLLGALAVSTLVLLGSALLITNRPARPKPTLAQRMRPAAVHRGLLRHLVRKKPRRATRRPKGAAKGERKLASAPASRRPTKRARRRNLSRHAARRAARRVDRLLAALDATPTRTGPGRRRHRPGTARSRRAPDALAALDAILPTSSAGLGHLGRRGLGRRGLGLPGLARSSRLAAARRSIRSRQLRPKPGGASGLTRSAIRRIVARHRGRIRLCYERELLRSRRPVQGTLLVRWRIDMRGKVVRARATRDGIGRPVLRRCILGEIARWRFPRCSGGQCEVVFPFEFFARS